MTDLNVFLISWVIVYQLGSHDFIVNVFFPSPRAVSTTVDPFRDISLDLAPSSIINRTSTPFETNGMSVCVCVCIRINLEWNYEII